MNTKSQAARARTQTQWHKLAKQLQGKLYGAPNVHPGTPVDVALANWLAKEAPAAPPTFTAAAEVLAMKMSTARNRLTEGDILEMLAIVKRWRVPAQNDVNRDRN